MLVCYTSRALFCRNVTCDELEACCHGWGIGLLPAMADESGPTHGFFLFPSLSALTGVRVVVELSVATSGIKGG